MRRFVRTWTIVAGLALGAGAAGCKEDPMLRARAMHATEQPEEAEAALKEVLATNPKDFEARRLMADVHRFRGDFARTETELKALWDEKQFGDDAKEFAPEERAQRDLLENQFNELYTKWADSLDAKANPEDFERVLTAGLEWKPKSPPLNRQLVEFYLARADALAKEGKKLEAAQTYEKVLQLRAMPQQRKDAQDKANTLRAEAFAEEAKKRFEASVQPELVAAEQWDAEAGVMKLRVEADVDRRLRANEAGLAQARTEATPAIRAAVASIVERVGGIDPALAAQTPVKFDSGEEELKRGKYAVTLTMSLDDVIAAAHATSEKARKAALEAEKPANAEPSDPAEPAEGGAPAATNGATNGAAAPE